MIQLITPMLYHYFCLFVTGFDSRSYQIVRCFLSCIVLLFVMRQTQQTATSLYRGLCLRPFSISATQAWNRQPTELKLMCSTAAFKCSFKTLLFRAAYDKPTVVWWNVSPVYVLAALKINYCYCTLDLGTIWYSSSWHWCRSCDCNPTNWLFFALITWPHHTSH
jgi:hypothetical protein